MIGKGDITPDDYQVLKGFCEDKRWSLLVDLALPLQDKRNDAGHGAVVTSWAAYLADEAELPVNREILLAAALLHDVGWSRLSTEERETLFRHGLSSAEERDLRRRHEQEGALLAASLLKEAGYGSEDTDTVAGLIDGHDTREEFLSPEDGLLRDADSLWMVTAQGFAADLKRRSLSPAAWASVLERRFIKSRAFYLEKSRNLALRRLSRLKRGKDVAPPGGDAKPRVLICHYRVGWTDGVSLEIEKRQAILDEMGFTGALLAGPGSQGADYVVEDLDFDTPEARKISSNAFGGLKDYPDEETLLEHIKDLSDRIETQLRDVFLEYRPDFIFFHNIFSHGRHIAAARAFCRLLEEFGIPALATHHDFYWERDDFRNPSGKLVQEFLDRYVPPVLPGLKHATINSLAGRMLLKRNGIDAMIFPDTLDFSVSPWLKDDFNSALLEDFDLDENDIFILQATRIVRRKGIELIPPLIQKLNSPAFLDRLKGKTLYNGKKVMESSRFVFLLAGYAEQEAEPYKAELEKMMNESGVPYCFLRDRIAAERSGSEEGRVYSLFDTYPHADLVSYPSLYEGWGNQFIEAVFARKPVVVHEYPVFKTDILPKGYDVVSLGDGAFPGNGGLYALPEKDLDRACGEIVEWLCDPETEKKLENNFEKARANNSYDYLRSLMRQSMEHYEDL